MSAVKKFYGRHHDLVDPYDVAVFILFAIVSQKIIEMHFTRRLTYTDVEGE